MNSLLPIQSVAICTKDKFKGAEMYNSLVKFSTAGLGWMVTCTYYRQHRIWPVRPYCSISCIVLCLSTSLSNATVVSASINHHLWQHILGTQHGVKKKTLPCTSLNVVPHLGNAASSLTFPPWGKKVQNIYPLSGNSMYF